MPKETAAAINLHLGFVDDDQRQAFLTALETLITNTTNNIQKANRTEYDQAVLVDDTGSGIEDVRVPIRETMKEVHYNPETEQYVIVQEPPKPKEDPPEGE